MFLCLSRGFGPQAGTASTMVQAIPGFHPGYGSLS
jgi:hypothetical protein